MTTILTKTSWEDENRNSLGTWTNQIDKVDEGNKIQVDIGVIANTLEGDDIITGTSETGKLDIGIFNEGTINTNNGNDNITGNGEPVGITNFFGTINTGNGNDTITGNSEGEFGITGITNFFGTINTANGDDSINGNGQLEGISNNGIIDTGNRNDTIIGNGNNIGITNFDSSTINTRNGNDTITGNGQLEGISNNGIINTGNGNDTITGNSENEFGTGIDNDGGIINTGRGNDTIDALSGGFNSINSTVGTINLGKDNDLIRGFGEQNVFGDQGFDKSELGVNFDQVNLSNGSDSSINITLNNETMTFTDVELFDFNSDKFTLRELQELA